MMRLFLALALCLVAGSACANTRTSANYSITTEAADGGGTTVSSANYANNGSVGGISGFATVVSPSETVKSGYVGQLYQVTGLELAPTFADDGTAQQLDATQTLDDGTLLVLNGSSQSWRVVSGQIPAGLSLNTSDGVISGTPTGSGTYSFTIQVTDGLGDSAQQTFSGVLPTFSDTPTMPPWTLALLAMLLLITAAKSFAKRHVARCCRAVWSCSLIRTQALG